MKRPNPWILIPTLLVGLLVGWLGWIATRGLLPGGSSARNARMPGVATLIGIICFIGATVGLTVVLAMTGRSIAEYRQQQEEE